MNGCVSNAPASLSEGTVHLWLCGLATSADKPLLTSWRALLTPEESSHCDRIRDPQQQSRALLTRVLVRTALSHYEPTSPDRWRFTTDSRGKPRVESPESSLRFNLSHSGKWVVCAVTDDAELGVDVEYCNPDRDLLRLAARYFDPAELHALQTLTGQQRVERFYDYWTLKESWLKATGLGIGGGLDQVVFELHNNGRLDHHICEGASSVGFQTWALDKNYRLSLCFSGQSVAIIPVEFLTNHKIPSLILRYASQHIESNLKAF